MKPKSQIRNRSKQIWPCVGISCASLLVLAVTAMAQTRTKSAENNPPTYPAGPEGLATLQQAADALIQAADKFDVPSLDRIFGRDGEDIVETGEPARDRERAETFAAEAREKTTVSVDPKNPNQAFLVIGKEDYPFPVPIVKRNNQWVFDAKAGREEILNRRIGRDELDAIQICHGYVEAQHEYALEKRQGYDVNQYAQRIISTPGKQDGLAWRNPDGTWSGPVGEKVAQAIEV